MFKHISNFLQNIEKIQRIVEKYKKYIVLYLDNTPQQK